MIIEYMLCIGLRSAVGYIPFVSIFLTYLIALAIKFVLAVCAHIFVIHYVSENNS